MLANRQCLRATDGPRDGESSPFLASHRALFALMPYNLETRCCFREAKEAHVPRLLAHMVTIRTSLFGSSPWQQQLTTFRALHPARA